MTWKTVAIAAVAGVALGGGVGYFARPQPAVHREIEADAKAASATQREERKQEGPADRDWTFYGPGPGAETPVLPSAPPIAAARTGTPRPAARGQDCAVVATMHEHVGPVTTELRESTVKVEEQRVREQFTVTPSPRPGWAVQVGLDDAFARRDLRLELRRRLLGPFWVGVSGVPDRLRVGASLSVEW